MPLSLQAAAAPRAAGSADVPRPSQAEAEAAVRTLLLWAGEVLIEAEHMRMAMRGFRKVGSTTLTSAFTSIFHEDAAERSRFLSTIHAGPVR